MFSTFANFHEHSVDFSKEFLFLLETSKHGIAPFENLHDSFDSPTFLLEEHVMRHHNDLEQMYLLVVCADTI